MNEKLENILKLALETNEAERIMTESLNVGFDETTRSWELIVKYHGSLDELEKTGIVVEYLIAGYAILTVPQSRVEEMAAYEQIEYVEKPKRFFYSDVKPTGQSCITPVTLREPFLDGRGVLIAVLDSGIDYRRNDFRDENGKSRIIALWDQTLNPENVQGEVDSPEGFSQGVEFDKERIDEALKLDTREAFDLVPSLDVSGHGTAVAGIAAGRAVERIQGEPFARTLYEGVAKSADLLIVKLGNNKESGFPRTTEIMRGVTYAVKKALALNMPLVINLSFGNSYGSHDGSSLLERFLDNASEIGRTVICVGSGNDADSRGHYAGNVTNVQNAALSVAQYEATLNVQLWKNYNDVYNISIMAPSGLVTELPSNIENGKYTVTIDGTKLLIYFGEPSPYSVAQEIYFEFIPQNGPYITSGIWTFMVKPKRVVTGQFYMYLPGGNVLSSSTGFIMSTPEMTLTIPSTASKVITVGAYDTTFDSYAAFSGRGFSVPDRTIGVVTSGINKPDLTAPGVGVIAPNLYGGYGAYTGTSFATPIVSGSAALLMQWGIVNGNDPFLYGEKVKAYLRKGAQPLRGETEYPNDKVGFGALCVSESLPG